MKKSIFSFVLLFTCATFFVNTLFAAVEPVPGVDVVVKKHPGGNAMPVVHTGKDGKFSLDLPAGDYDLTISYADVVKAMSAVKTFDANSITLTYSSSDTKTLVPLKAVISKTSGPITITVHAKSATISGTLTYEPKVVSAASAVKPIAVPAAPVDQQNKDISKPKPGVPGTRPLPPR